MPSLFIAKQRMQLVNISEPIMKARQSNNEQIWK